MRTDTTHEATVIATDGAGRELGRDQVTFVNGDAQADVKLAMPSELRNRVARLTVENQASAATIVLLDPRWQRRPVGSGPRRLCRRLAAAG